HAIAPPRALQREKMHMVMVGDLNAIVICMRKLSSAVILLVALVFAAAPLAQQKDGAIADIDAKSAHYAGVAHQIWNFAELGYQEQKSSALLQSELTAAGFAVTAGVAEIPTAFVATFGSGKPVIAIVGEFDALPGLSQEA